MMSATRSGAGMYWRGNDGANSFSGRLAGPLPPGLGQQRARRAGS